MRKINKQPKKLEDLMFTNIADSIKKNVLVKNKGLFFVTGPTGAGKTTSIIAMLNEINNVRSDNIITIEDPIEYVFKQEKCLISQREVGHDTWSYKNALKSAMREDPDIIFVGDLIAYSEADLLKSRNFGKKSLEELEHHMQKYSLSFETSIDNWEIIREDLINY